MGLIQYPKANIAHPAGYRKKSERREHRRSRDENNNKKKKKEEKTDGQKKDRTKKSVWGSLMFLLKSGSVCESVCLLSYSLNLSPPNQLSNKTISFLPSPIYFELKLAIRNHLLHSRHGWRVREVCRILCPAKKSQKS